MADKTTTLKTKTNDNVYPNVIGDNRDNAIVDSAHIKHTLTADHKINFRIDDNVSNLIFNSLQKPKGLTKTELVGVGANGQENIEIGDNLTLANGKLSATGGGGGGNSGSSILRKDATFVSKEEGTIINTISLSSEESIKIRNGEINIIYGEYDFEVGGHSLYKVDFTGKLDNMYIYGNTDIVNENNETDIFNFQLVLNENTCLLYIIKTISPSIPTLPSDASTSTYVLKAVNGTVQWVKES